MTDCHSSLSSVWSFDALGNHARLLSSYWQRGRQSWTCWSSSYFATLCFPTLVRVYPRNIALSWVFASCCIHNLYVATGEKNHDPAPELMIYALTRSFSHKSRLSQSLCIVLWVHNLFQSNMCLSQSCYHSKLRLAVHALSFLIPICSCTKYYCTKLGQHSL